MLIWAVVLLFAALAFIVLEAFVPSLGILSILAGLSLIASISAAFYVGVGTGVTFLAVATLGIPFVLFVMMKFWPHTPIGRLILMERPEDQDDVLPETEEYRGLKSLIGRRGVARTKMLPSGAVAIDNRMFDALTAGVPIEAGQLIEVIGVDMGHLVVAPLEESDLEETTSPDSDSAESALSEPLEAFGLDDLEEPLNS